MDVLRGSSSCCLHCPSFISVCKGFIIFDAFVYPPPSTAPKSKQCSLAPDLLSCSSPSYKVHLVCPLTPALSILHTILIIDPFISALRLTFHSCPIVHGPEVICDRSSRFPLSSSPLHTLVVFPTLCRPCHPMSSLPLLRLLRLCILHSYQHNLFPACTPNSRLACR